MITPVLKICGLFVIFNVASNNVAQGLQGPSVYQLTQPIDHGECPVWDPRVGILYFVDLHNGKVLGYNYSKDKITFSKSWCQKDVAPVIPSKNDQSLLFVGLNRTLAIAKIDQCNNSKREEECIDDESDTKNRLATVQETEPRSRFNDGKADSKGRLWIGSMGYEYLNGTLEPDQGKLFKFSRNNIQQPEIVIAPVNISNGMAWNRADNKFYYIDTPSQKIMEFEYDNQDGTITNGTIVFNLRENGLTSCYPDGMTIDEKDNLWIALYGCGSVIQVDPFKHKLVRRIPIPAKCVTSLAWGGPDLDILFVTTSRFSLSAKERMEQPGAGSLFAIVNLNTKGLPSYFADIY